VPRSVAAHGVQEAIRVGVNDLCGNLLKVGASQRPIRLSRYLRAQLPKLIFDDLIGDARKDIVRADEKESSFVEVVIPPIGGNRRREHLDGDGSIDRGVVRLEHDAHTAGAERPRDFVAANPFANRHVRRVDTPAARNARSGRVLAARKGIIARRRRPRKLGYSPEAIVVG
jgi:hypothetical protein